MNINRTTEIIEIIGEVQVKVLIDQDKKEIVGVQFRNAFFDAYTMKITDIDFFLEKLKIMVGAAKSIAQDGGNHA